MPTTSVVPAHQNPLLSLRAAKPQRRTAKAARAAKDLSAPQKDVPDLSINNECKQSGSEERTPSPTPTNTSNEAETIDCSTTGEDNEANEVVEDAVVPEYETQRLENIKRNREMMAALGLNRPPVMPSPSFMPTGAAKRPPVSRKRKAPPATSAPSPKRRTSSRLRGLPPVAPYIEDPDALMYGAIPQVNSDGSESPENQNQDNPPVFEITGPCKAEDFFPPEVKENAIFADGHYSGWLEPELQSRLGLASSASEAWEMEGGGKYSHSNPLGNNESIGRGGAKPAGWSTAKWTAWRGMRKNPNAFFYRHVEPGKVQRLDPFDEQETETFLKIAREYGCGDKWGLFSTWIPGRVGYQCSNFYRSVVIPQGLVFDPNYRLSGSPGNATSIYVGGKGVRE